jgi:hypothetical protein
MHDPAAEPFSALVPEHERFKSFHLVDPLKGGLSRGAACIEVGRNLFPKLLWFWNLPWLKTLADAFYWVVFRIKPLAGRFARDIDGPWELP